MPNLLSRVTGIYPDMPPVFDCKQVVLSGFVFSQKLKPSQSPANAARVYNSTHSQTVELGEAGGRVSFYFCSKTIVV